MSDVVGTRDFIPWEGGCAFIGRAGHITRMHAHYAIQIGIGSEHGIRFRADERADWTPYHGVVIASRQPHMMDSTLIGYSLIIFIEPETPVGRALAVQHQGDGIASLTAAPVLCAAARLFDTWKRHGNCSLTLAALQGVVDSIAQGTHATVVLDERILRAVAYIRSHLNASLTLERVAAEACLSPSRFRHLFVEQTGTALRPYILWRRFLLAWEMVTHGDSLSAAAHAAGFADAAHLTRTSRRMFGFPPSALQIKTHSPGGTAAADSWR